MTWDDLLAAYELATILLITFLAVYGLGWMLLHL